MKRARTIIIKDPKLRKIRDNLRKILILECVARQEKIVSRKRELQLDEDGNVRALASKEEEEVIELSLELRGYIFSLRNSILFCQLCHSTNKDMSYNLKENQWYCIDCTNELEFSRVCECMNLH